MKKYYNFAYWLLFWLFSVNINRESKNNKEIDIYKNFEKKNGRKKDKIFYKPGEIVWGKVKGYPWWPAIVN